MNKIVGMIYGFLFAILFSSSAFSNNGGQNGNGGDIVDDELASIAQIQNSLNDSALFIRLWLNGLEGQMRPDIGIRGKPKRNLEIPLGAEKLFADHGAAYRVLNQLHIVFKTQSACDAASGHSDGSTVASNPFTICISGYSLSKKLTQLNFKLQTEALILHELAHLVGASEEEARSIQRVYLSDMQFVPKDPIPQRVDDLSDGAQGISAYIRLTLKNQMNDQQKFCKTVLDIRKGMYELTEESELPAISYFNADDRDKLDNILVVTEFAWTAFACGNGSDEQAYRHAFQGREKIEVRDWLTKYIEKKKWEVRPSKIKFEIAPFQKISDMNLEIETVGNILSSQARRVFGDYLTKPTIILDNKKAP